MTTQKARFRVNVRAGAVIQTVSVSNQHKQWAAKQAASYIGRSYRNNFLSNKTESGPMNCSQVVWAAYKYGAGIDLDSNGGLGVYPYDVRNSQYTKTIRSY